MATSVRTRNRQGADSSSHATTSSTPEPPFRRTGRRLNKAPCDALAIAAARILGCGNRTSLLLAATGAGAGPDVPHLSRQAVASLRLVHQERLLEAVNLALLEAGRPLV